MVKIAIVDDNRADVDIIKQLLKECDAEYEIAEYFTTDSFLTVIDSEQFDIVFLDIILDESDGIEIGLKLNKLHPNTNVIFISQNPDYFRDVYKVNHSYFLTKKLEKDRFFDAVFKAVRNIKKDSIVIGTKTGACKINLKKVLCFESCLKHTKVHMQTGEVAEYNINIKTIEKDLPASAFVRVHQSFIVNIDYIKKYDSQNVFLECDITVPISRNYSKTAREKITCYLGGII